MKRIHTSKDPLMISHLKNVLATFGIKCVMKNMDLISAAGQLPPDFVSQADNTFQNIGRCLSASGAKFEDIVKINYYVTDLSNTTELRRIRAKYLNQSAPPASTLVQAELIGKGLLLEVEALAIVPE